MMSRGSRSRAGWSLIELTIILTVLSVLAAIMAPTVTRYMRKAKVIRAREDVQALGSAIAMFITDTANSYFMKDGSPGVTPQHGAGRGDELASTTGGAPNQESANRVDLLVTDGDIPELVTQVVEDSANDNTQWRAMVDYDDVDFFEYHLVTNTPGNNINNAYRVPTDYTYAPTGNTGNGDTDQADSSADPGFARNESAGFNSEFSWRGPYMTGPLDPDPWGNRYMSNVRFLDPIADSKNDDSWDNAAESDGGTIGEATGQDAGKTGAGFTNDCIVLSAGPDEEVDTGWNLSNDQHTTTNGDHDNNITPGDDDIIYTVSGNSRP